MVPLVGFGRAPLPYRRNGRKPLWKPINPLPETSRYGSETVSWYVHGNLPNPLPLVTMLDVLSASIRTPILMTNFLTVKEAAKVTAKSPSSIRRIIYPILEDDSHVDRHHIEPDVETAKTLRAKGDNFAWKISQELLDRVLSAEGNKTKSESKQSPIGDNQSDAIIDILRKQLDIKDQQIANMNERLREGNILMGTLQQQLALSDGNRSKSNTVDVSSTESNTRDSGREGSGATPKISRWKKLLHMKII